MSMPVPMPARMPMRMSLCVRNSLIPLTRMLQTPMLNLHPTQSTHATTHTPPRATRRTHPFRSSRDPCAERVIGAAAASVVLLLLLALRLGLDLALLLG